MPTTDFFRSFRLVYRAIPAPGQKEADPLEFLFKKLLHDPSRINFAPVVWAPPNPADAERIKAVDTSGKLLSVYICIPVPASTPGSVPDPTQDVLSSSTSRISVDKSTSIPAPEKSVEPQANVVPIGITHLTVQQPLDRFGVHRKASIGITICSEYQSKGYGGEALRWVTDWGFRFAGLHRMEIACNALNEGAARLYQRTGFVKEGVRRKAGWAVGAWRDVLDFGMLEEEFWELGWVENKGVRDGNEAAVKLLGSQ